MRRGGMGKSSCEWSDDFACSVRLEVYDEGEFLPLPPNEASQRTLRHLHACTRCIEFFSYPRHPAAW